MIRNSNMHISHTFHEAKLQPVDNGWRTTQTL